MSETSQSPRRSFGEPFWISYALSSVGWFMLVIGLNILNGDLGSWLTVLVVCVALGVVGPFGGLILQAVHGFCLAVWRGQYRFWHVALLLAIVVASFVAGYLYYLYGEGSPLWFPW
jgi:hypothetical protein